MSIYPGHKDHVYLIKKDMDFFSSWTEYVRKNIEQWVTWVDEYKMLVDLIFIYICQTDI